MGFIKQLTFILLVFFTTVSFAQEKQLDSIGKVLKEYKERDTTRVSLLIEYTKYYQVRSVDSMLPLVQEAIDISEEIMYKRGVGYSRNALTSYYILKGEIDKALQAALEAKEILESIHDIRNLTFNNNLLARIYVNNDQPEKALAMHLDNIRLIKDTPDSDQKGGFYYYAAFSYEVVDSLDQAQKYYQEAYAISERANFALGKVLASAAIGNLHNKRMEFAKAIPPLKEALEYHRTHKQSSSIANMQFGLAHSFSKLGDQEQAIQRNNEAIAIYKNQDRKIALRDAYRNQIAYYLAKGDVLGENRALKNYHALNDSIFSEEKVKIIEELETKYETQKIVTQKDTAEAQVAVSKAESERNRTFFIGALVVIGLLLLATILYYGRLRAKKKAELITLELRETQKRLALEKQYRDSELKALKAQMNPHFIFNALNSIQEYIILNKKDLAGDYLGKFADLMRKYLDHSDAGYITLHEEVDSLNMYLELESLRFEESLEYTIKTAASIDQEFIKIPTMLIQPYVENALKHGLLHLLENRKLTIFFSQESEHAIQCIITDNGIGRAASAKIQEQRGAIHQSFATQATENRLELLNQTQIQKIGVHISDLYNDDGTARGTKVQLDIPILKK